MKKIFFLLLIAIVLLNSCKKNDSNPINPAFTEVKIAETAVIANTNTVYNLISADSSSLIFNKNASQIQDLKVGSILIVDKGEGFLRKVFAIEQQGSNYKVITENAKLEDVIISGDFEKELILEPGNLNKCQFSNYKIKLEKTNDQFLISFNNLVVGAENGTSVIINGQTQFSAPKINIKASYKNGLDALNVTLEINSNTKFALKTDGKMIGGYKITPPWGEFTFTPILFFVGTVPIKITPKIKLVFGANVSLDGKVDYNFDSDTKFIGSLIYRNKDLSTKATCEHTYNNQNITSNAKGSVEGYILLPKLGLYFYSFAGPFIDLKFYGSLRAKTSNSAGLYYGLFGECGLETDILGSLILPNTEWKKTIMFFENEIKNSNYQVNHPPNLPILISPLDNGTNIASNSLLNWSCSDPDGDSLTYDVYLGTASIPPLVSSKQKLTQYDPGTLMNNTRYYWKIKARDDKDSISESSIWSFVTKAGGAISINGLVAYYPFNSDANDKSGNGLDGIINGAALTPDRFGNLNKAFYFDGNQGYIKIPHNEKFNFTNSMSISLWVRPVFSNASNGNSPNVLMYPIRKIEQKWKGAPSWDIYFENYNKVYGVNLNTSISDLNNNISRPYNEFITSGYSHLAMVYDGTKIYLYVNGNLRDSNTKTGQVINQNIDIYLGQFMNYWFYKGDIDDIRIYNRALTGEEVMQLFLENGW